MSAALIAGRARLRAVVVNTETPRNAVTTASHGFLTRDGTHPTELLEIAKQQLTKHETVRYVHATATDLSDVDGRFAIDLADGASLTAEWVIIATGYRDDLSRLNLPGIEDVYGKSVYPCPFCDGFERRDERLAVFGGPGVDFFVPVVRVWSEDLVVFTNGAPIGTDARDALERKVRVVEDRVARLISRDGNLKAVELSTGEQIEREAGFVADDPSVPNTDFAERLGVTKTTNDWGMQVLDVDATGKSAVQGVYVVGDSKNGFTGLIAAASEGAACAEAIAHELADERWQAASD